MQLIPLYPHAINTFVLLLPNAINTFVPPLLNAIDTLAPPLLNGIDTLVPPLPTVHFYSLNIMGIRGIYGSPVMFFFKNQGSGAIIQNSPAWPGYAPSCQLISNFHRVSLLIRHDFLLNFPTAFASSSPPTTNSLFAPYLSNPPMVNITSLASLLRCH